MEKGGGKNKQREKGGKKEGLKERCMERREKRWKER